MTKEKRYLISLNEVRDCLNQAIKMADQILEDETALVRILYQIDQQRFYVRYGYKSLMGFCQLGLRFSKTQSQRLVTVVRRYEPAAKIGK